MIAPSSPSSHPTRLGEKIYKKLHFFLHVLPQRCAMFCTQFTIVWQNVHFFQKTDTIIFQFVYICNDALRRVEHLDNN